MFAFYFLKLRKSFRFGKLLSTFFSHVSVVFAIYHSIVVLDTRILELVIFMHNRKRKLQDRNGIKSNMPWRMCNCTWKVLKTLFVVGVLQIPVCNDNRIAVNTNVQKIVRNDRGRKRCELSTKD